MLVNKMNIISGITEVILGLLIAFIFIIFYFYSDFSNQSETVVLVFQILYLGVIPFIGFILVVRGIYHLFSKKDGNSEKEI